MGTVPPQQLSISRSRATIPVQLSPDKKLAEKTRRSPDAKDMRAGAVSDYQLRTEEVVGMHVRTKWGHEHVERAQQAVAGHHKASAVILQ